METSLPKLNLTEPSVQSSRVTFRRKGNTYVIKNEGSNEDVIDVFNLIDEMYEDITYKSNVSSLKADIYKFCYLLTSIFIVVGGAVIGSLSINTYNYSQSITNNTININPSSVQSMLYAVTVIGFAITAIKSLSSLFNFEQRSITMKQISVQLRRISRAVKMLKNTTMSVEDYYKKMDEYNLLVDELEINMFGELNYPSDKIKQMNDMISTEENKNIEETKNNKQDTIINMV